MRVTIKVGTSTLAHPSGLLNIRRVEALEPVYRARYFARV